MLSNEKKREEKEKGKKRRGDGEEDHIPLAFFATSLLVGERGKGRGEDNSDLMKTTLLPTISIVEGEKKRKEKKKNPP